MALQTPVANLDISTFIYTGTNGGANTSGSNGVDTNWDYGYKVFIRPVGGGTATEIADIRTDATSFALDLNGLLATNNVEIFTKQYRCDSVFDLVSGITTSTYTYSAESNSIVILIKAKAPVITLDKSTGILNIKTEAVSHPEILPTVIGYYVNKANGSAWELLVPLINTNSLNYNLPLTITQSMDIMVYAVNADGSVGSPSNIVNITYIDIPQVSSFTVQNIRKKNKKYFNQGFNIGFNNGIAI